MRKQTFAQVTPDTTTLPGAKGLGSTPDIRNPEDTKAFVKNQYEAFKTLTEKLGMTIK